MSLLRSERASEYPEAEANSHAAKGILTDRNEKGPQRHLGCSDYHRHQAFTSMSETVAGLALARSASQHFGERESPSHRLHTLATCAESEKVRFCTFSVLASALPRRRPEIGHYTAMQPWAENEYIDFRGPKHSLVHPLPGPKTTAMTPRPIPSAGWPGWVRFPGFQIPRVCEACGLCEGHSEPP
jgi:hypothetical protein